MVAIRPTDRRRELSVCAPACDVSAQTSRHCRMEEYPPWPARMPAFDKNGAWCLPSSDAILEGNVDATGARPMYFVSKTGTVSPIRGVPPRAKMVGVGASGVYLAMESEDGLVTLARYQLAER